ncbi:hypothetical protein DKM44_06285 [Deinococcus irradiatisoli]|uniref:Prepilin-type cleavage/methylation domain-containing protein n=1 Tax=Deinococcus irradiatisoli TaxID=2202254 RepID=A0A2Z3JD73_9DEIO|nr:type II secretion system protein [Deinococcus irradiatisoli]AWN22885.1 hypothetical protein DKM44_06285 [Deinococcus irradiatisoli]
MNRQAIQGLTLVEILVAIALLGILVVLTAQPLLFSLNTSGISDRTLSATRSAQDVLERARAAVVNNYNSPSISAVTKPSGTTLVCQDLAPDGTVGTSCTSSTNNGVTPYMRRLTVTTSVTGQPDVVLSLDVRP